jgi:hypothetical protein
MTDNKVDMLQQLAEELAEFESMETEVNWDIDDAMAIKFEMEGL